MIRRRVLRATSVVLALVAVSAACSDESKADPTKPANEEVLDLGAGAAGTCLLVTEDFPAEVENLPTIRCDVAHTHEIFAVVKDLDHEVYPGVSALEEFAQRECLTSFDTFVGISLFDSTLSYSWLIPSLDSWNQKNDRDVLCVLQDGDGANLVGSMRDSRR